MQASTKSAVLSDGERPASISRIRFGSPMVIAPSFERLMSKRSRKSRTVSSKRSVSVFMGGSCSGKCKGVNR